MVRGLSCPTVRPQTELHNCVASRLAPRAPDFEIAVLAPPSNRLVRRRRLKFPSVGPKGPCVRRACQTLKETSFSVRPGANAAWAWGKTVSYLPNEVARRKGKMSAYSNSDFPMCAFQRQLGKSLVSLRFAGHRILSNRFGSAPRLNER